MGVDYAWEKFYSALHYAVASTAPLQERLAGVLSEIHHLQTDSFPNAEIWAEFEELLSKVADGEGTIQAITSQMTDTEAADGLHKALAIFAELAKLEAKE